MAAAHPTGCDLSFFSVGRAEVAWDYVAETGGHVVLESELAKLEEGKYSSANVVLNAMTHLRFPNVIDADLAMNMEYETAFGIYDHRAPEDPKVPWPLLAVSPRESLSRVDPLDFRLDQYAENRVGDIFHIGFDELIKFPRRDFLKVIEAAKKHNSRALGNLPKELSNLERALQQQNK